MSSVDDDQSGKNTEGCSSRFVLPDGKVNEPELLQACFRHDRAAFGFLILYYTPDVYAGVVQALIRVPHASCEAKDLVHDVFLEIIEAPRRRLSPATEGVNNLHRWLRTMARNRTLTRLGSHSVSWPPAGVIQDWEQMDEILDPSIGFIDPHQVLERVRATLSDASRAVFDLYWGWGTLAQPVCIIAKTLGLAVWVVYCKLARIKQRIRKFVLNEI